MPEEPLARSTSCTSPMRWRFRPNLVVVDSIGELLPMFGGDSNSADEYSAVHRAALTSFAATGAGVLALDHVSKGAGASLRGCDQLPRGEAGRGRRDVARRRHRGGRARLRRGGVAVDREGSSRRRPRVLADGRRRPRADRGCVPASSTSRLVERTGRCIPVASPMIVSMPTWLLSRVSFLRRPRRPT